MIEIVLPTEALQVLNAVGLRPDTDDLTDGLTAKDILIKTSEFLNADNWCRGQLAWMNAATGEMVAFCAVGAIRMVAGGSPRATAAANEAEHHVNRALGEFLTIWNDRPGRTVWEVKALLREVGEGLHE